MAAGIFNANATCGPSMFLFSPLAFALKMARAIVFAIAMLFRLFNPKGGCRPPKAVDREFHRVKICGCFRFFGFGPFWQFLIFLGLPRARGVLGNARWALPGPPGHSWAVVAPPGLWAPISLRGHYRGWWHGLGLAGLGQAQVVPMVAPRDPRYFLPYFPSWVNRALFPRFGAVT